MTERFDEPMKIGEALKFCKTLREGLGDEQRVVALYPEHILTQALDFAIKALEKEIRAEIWFEKPLEAENTPIHARKDDSQVNIPLNDIRAEIGDIKDEIVKLQIRVGLLERKAEL